MNKILYIFSLLIGLMCLFFGVLLSLLNFSDNKSDFGATYIPQVEAKINFYQDKLGKHNYSITGEDFYSSPKYGSGLYDELMVQYGSEDKPKVVDIEKVIFITKDSH